MHSGSRAAQRMIIAFMVPILATLLDAPSVYCFAALSRMIFSSCSALSYRSVNVCTNSGSASVVIYGCQLWFNRPFYASGFSALIVISRLLPPGFETGELTILRVSSLLCLPCLMLSLAFCQESEEGSELILVCGHILPEITGSHLPGL